MANAHDHRPGDPQSLHPPGIEESPEQQKNITPLVELSEVSASYGATPALQQVSLKIWPRQFMAIVGPNGGGKTTLLRTILGMIPVASGHMRLRGTELKRAALERICGGGDAFAEAVDRAGQRGLAAVDRDVQLLGIEERVEHEP